MRGLIKRLSILISVCIIALFAICLTNNNGGNNSIDAPVRDVELVENNIDYQKLFNEFDEAKLLCSEDKEYISFSGIQLIDSSELEELDLVDLTTNNNELEVEYGFEYYEDTNLFVLNTKIRNVDGGEIIDNLEGMPFINEFGDTDIAFVIDDEVVLLSEFLDNSLIEACGWFKKAIKKVAPVAGVILATAAVVAVVVVAAPAVVAAIPTVSTVALAGGGTATVLTGGGAAAAMAAASAAAAATLPTIATATATVIAVAAVEAGVEAALEEAEDSKSEKVKKQIDDLLEDSEEGRETSGKSEQYLKKGGFEQANKDYDKLNPKDSKEIETDYGKGRTGTLADGSKVNVRPGSSYGEPTLEIQFPNGRRVKIRYGN